MGSIRIFELLGWGQKEDSIAALDEQLRNYLSEIITLQHIREEQNHTISELRSENFRLRKELQRLKGAQ